MKSTRPTAFILVIVPVGVAILGFLYAVPYGRDMRRESVRVFRVAGNVTGIYTTPIVKLRTRTAARGALSVEVYESGRVVVSGRGTAFEAQLAPQVAREIFETARLALGDFSANGCGTSPGGIASDLYLLLDGRRVGSTCREAAEWPQGSETKRLLEQLANQVPGLSNRF